MRRSSTLRRSIIDRRGLESVSVTGSLKSERISSKLFGRSAATMPAWVRHKPTTRPSITTLHSLEVGTGS